jgi:hypothetical protein
MKITVHELCVEDGTEDCLLRGIHPAVLDDKAADVCRHYWKYVDRLLDVPVPESDREVLALYFDEEDENRSLERIEYELDLSPLPGVPIDLSMPAGPPCSLVTDGEGGSAISGTISDEPGVECRMNDIVAALEAFTLELAGAGFPVHLPEFRTCLQHAMEHCSSHGLFDEDEK